VEDSSSEGVPAGGSEVYSLISVSSCFYDQFVWSFFPLGQKKYVYVHNLVAKDSLLRKLAKLTDNFTTLGSEQLQQEPDGYEQSADPVLMIVSNVL
jgi:hypothetical protein